MITNFTGFLLINKPINSTSFDCIRQVKRIVQSKIKIGHAGTLDPFATGLLILGIERQATKKLPYIMACNKEYVAKGKLGELRDTLDSTGSIIKITPIPKLTKQDLEQAILSLGNVYKQIPPIYSALKHRGMPLYKLARNKQLPTEQLQKIALLKAKIVQLHSVVLLDFSPPYFTIRVSVSSGTYIRSLIDSIGNQVGSCATTYTLMRTKIGPFNLEDAIYLAQLTNIWQHIIPIEEFIKKITLHSKKHLNLKLNKKRLG